MKNKIIKDQIIKILKQIKIINDKQHKLYKLGVDIIEISNGVDLLGDSISYLFYNGENEADIKIINDWVDWWLYESVNKIVYEKDKTETDLNKIEDFVDYLIINYLKYNE